MIGLLRGQPHLIDGHLILDVNGVGYLVNVGSSLLTMINFGQELSLHIYTHVKEDKLELYGFNASESKKLFQLLLDVSGVGPKTALVITDRGATEIRTAVQEANIKFFSSIPRVGKRMAQKIIIELKPKLGSLKELELGPLSPNLGEAMIALESLGYDEQSAREALREIDAELEVQQIIKLALKKM